MSTPHNRAEKGDFAKTVLMPGDPLRAKFIAETFLENPRLVTDVRGMYGFTGTYQGRPISVMAQRGQRLRRKDRCRHAGRGAQGHAHRLLRER